MRVNDKENYDNIKNSITMNNLKNIIKEKNYLITKVAINSKVSDTTIKSYMNGSKIPSLPSLISIADFFNCNLDYLLDRTSNPLKVDEIINLNNKKELSMLLKTIIELPKDKQENVKAFIKGIQNN